MVGPQNLVVASPTPEARTLQGKAEDAQLAKPSFAKLIVPLEAICPNPASPPLEKAGGLRWRAEIRVVHVAVTPVCISPAAAMSLEHGR